VGRGETGFIWYVQEVYLKGACPSKLSNIRSKSEVQTVRDRGGQCATDKIRAAKLGIGTENEGKIEINCNTTDETTSVKA
jgi:hypothetical protein